MNQDTNQPVWVIGAGLAGCEAAWTLAQQGVAVRLYEMKPQQYTPAHQYKGFAELICSIPSRLPASVRRQGCSRRKCAF